MAGFLAMTHVALKPCICGTHWSPRVIRRGTASLLVSMQCPNCKRRTPISRVEHVDDAWNRMVDALQEGAQR